MNEPKLRFKADDGSQFPDWEEKKFANLYRKNVEKNVNLEFDSSKTISIASMQFNEKGNGASEDSLSSYKVLRLGDIAFEGHENKEYSHGRFVLNDIGDGIMSPRFSCMRPVCTQVDGFWKYYIHSERVMRNILIHSTKKGTMMHELVIPDFLKQSIMVPSFPEQQKIAEFLSTIDTVIRKQKETVSAWEECKKGVMQKLFSQKVRFKEDDGSEFPEWEEKKIDDVASCFAGATPSTKISEYWEDGTIRWMSSGEVNNGQIHDTEKRISQLGFDKCSTKMVKPNTVVMALAGQGKTRGMVAITRVPLCTNQSLCAIETNDDICDDYLYQYLQTQYNNLRLISSGDGTRGGLNLKLVGGYIVGVPCLVEQQKIADCLLSLDEVIEKQKATLAAWEELKKGLLQQMFV